MSTLAYKCAHTGKLHEGEGKKQMLVDISKTLSLLIYPQERLDATHTQNCPIGPEAEAAIAKALVEALTPKHK